MIELSKKGACSTKTNLLQDVPTSELSVAGVDNSIIYISNLESQKQIYESARGASGIATDLRLRDLDGQPLRDGEILPCSRRSSVANLPALVHEYIISREGCLFIINSK